MLRGLMMTNSFYSSLVTLTFYCSYVNSDRQTILVNITLCIMLMLAIFAGAVFMSTMKIVPEKYSAVSTGKYNLIIIIIT